MFQQLRLSFRMMGAAARMTWRYPQSLLVAFANLAFLVGFALLPLVYMINLMSKDWEAGYAFFNAFYQWWIVDQTLPHSLEAAQQWDFGTTAAAFTLWLLVVYFLWVTVVTFASLVTATVIMHTGVQQLRGQKPSVMDGLSLAGRNVLRLAGLAVLAGALLTLVKRTLVVLRVVPFLGRWIQRAAIAAITATLYIVLPIVVYERNGVFSAFRSTWTNIRKTWGGLAVGTGFALGALWFGMWFVEVMFVTVLQQNVPPEALEAMGISAIGWTEILVFQCFMAVLLYCVNIAFSANLRAALYLHVVEGHTGVIPQEALSMVKAPASGAGDAATAGGFQLSPPPR